MFWNRDIRHTYKHMLHKDEVIFTGRLEPEQLKDVPGAALALTYVPVFEGFGIPIVEAFQSEISVIISDVSSMSEVAGDTALLVNPFSEGAIA